MQTAPCRIKFVNTNFTIQSIAMALIQYISRYRLLVLASSVFFLSCNRSEKYNSPEELGKTVFELFQKKETSRLKALLISKSEIETAFGNSPQNQKLTDEERKVFINSTYERNKEIGEGFIDFYTGGDPAATKMLASGKLEKTTSEVRNDNGTSVAWIVNHFTVEGKTLELNLRAAKVKDYWKLLSWIEVK